MAALIAIVSSFFHDLIAGRSPVTVPQSEKLIIATSAPSFQPETSPKAKKQKSKNENDEKPAVTGYPDNAYFTEEDPCASCEQGCDHPKLPSSLEKTIDYGEPLLGTMKPYALHICIIEGSSSGWPERIEQDPTTITAKFTDLAHKTHTDYRVLVSAIDISYTPSDLHVSPEQASGRGVDIMILPHKWILRGVRLDQIGGVLDSLIHSKTLDASIRVNKMADKDVFIFVCTHKKRDRRCGVAGPMLIDEFTVALKELTNELDGYKIHVCGISHIGGHKFAGNLILYAPKTHGDWYGRVKTCHVRSIIQESILEGKVFKSLWRGQMNKSPSLTW
ncbi:hypothetical protein SeMB42_g00553 [Synchytrium endobioticum]|uniref:Uncharacterized protein n=1 Tax=Synchytrium endobioticum TaxID=286115 RepID=A0A507DGG3_9FUNG|nr:hypothetical protein SeLEV6574_g01165 [Synchytrium endobioticum]TPX53919.1 hypothetical protein SeMB42_g00553 [Synchytrium endobioticum]